MKSLIWGLVKSETHVQAAVYCFTRCDKCLIRSINGSVGDNGDKCGNSSQIKPELVGLKKTNIC